MNSQETSQCQSPFIDNELFGRMGRLQTNSLLLTALLSLLVVLAWPADSFAQSALTDDAQVSLASGNGNNGTNPNLNVSAGENIYLKFKLSSALPANMPGAEVEKATLKLYIGNIRRAGRLDVYAVAGAWDEREITGSEAPPLGGLVTTTAQIGENKLGKFLVIDITSLVQQWLGVDGQGTNGLPNNGLALVAHPVDASTLAVADITFDSKENSQTSHEAQLYIQLERAADGLQKVEHDASLTGDGTSALPLGVANGGINSLQLAIDSVTSEKLTNNAVTSTELADGAVTSSKISAPLSLTSANANFTLSAANTGTGAAITAAGAINTSMQYNIGGNRILSNAGTNNLFAGIGAGAGNTTGTGNAFFGQQAGHANSGGSNNSFFGSNAGLANTTGFQLSFFGRDAGASNTTGSFNSFFGRSAGFSNTTGSGNAFFGQDAGLLNTTGQINAFFGNSAGRSNETGSSNAFFGTFAGDSNTTGSGNAFFGTSAGISNTSGTGNTFIGRSADFNVADPTGNNNTLLGFVTRVASGVSNSTAIGVNAQVTQSDSLVLGRVGASAPNVGIGTTAPKTKLHVTNGKIFVEANGQGVIMKSPGGACFELTVTNTGALTTTPVACP